MRELWRGLALQKKMFLLLAAICGFLISMDYAIVRPVSQSVFIHFFGTKNLPYVWICSIPLNFCIVALYNRLVPSLGCFPFFTISCLCIAGGNALSWCFLETVPLCSFFLYIWKEVYVLLMFQQVWAVIHATIEQKQAKYIYGVLFGIGALGGFLGSLVPGFFAVTCGSESLIISSLPIYALLSVAYFWLLRYSGSQEEKVEAKKTKNFASFRLGARLISSSTLLRTILVLCLCMQVMATFADFQFQTSLAEAFPEKDMRTEHMGQLICLGNILTMTLQFVGSFALIHMLGLHRAHLLVPSILAIGMVFCLWTPSFFAISTFFVIIKALEFSLFTVIKEMLYIPMRLEEKFQAKSIIDVFMGRFAKIVASICIVGVQALFPSYTAAVIGSLMLAIALQWIYVVYIRKEYYEKLDSPRRTELKT